MASLSKLQRLSNTDRISDLPDSLLLHILSFLPAKSAALTSSLSKRWKNLYMSLPNLNFNDEDFSGNPSNFIRCVDSMLTARRNNVVLERFSLACSEDMDPGRVDSWLMRPVGCYNVKVINLSLDFTNLYTLPTQVYTCTTLQALTLNSSILIDVPEFLSLPRLGVLELCGVVFSSSESVEKLLSNCPVLERLIIQDCSCVTGDRVKIVGSALKTLRLQYSEFFDEEFELVFMIDAPALVNLYINKLKSVEIKTQMPSLEIATIDDYLSVQKLELSSVRADRLFGIMGMISHVRRLTLSSDAVAVLSGAAKHTLPIFHNLTDLELSFDGEAARAPCSFLPKVLASSLVLVNLVLPHGLPRGFYSARRRSRLSFIRPENVPDCLSFHLKNVEIRDFWGTAEELIIIQYMLHHGRLLKRMSIDCSRWWLKEMTEGIKRKRHRPLILSEIKKKLLEFPRCSRSCKLDVSP